MSVSKADRVLPFLNPWTCGVVFFQLAAFLFFYQRTFDDRSGMSWLFLLMILQSTPFLIAFTRKYYDYISFVLFNQFIVYSVATWNQTTNLRKLNFLFPETQSAIRALIVCTVLMMATYYLVRALFFYQPPEKQRFLSLSMSRRQLWWLAGYVILVPVTLDYIPAQVLIIHFALLAADMLLLMCSTTRGGEMTAMVLKAIVPLSCFAYFLKTGFLSMAGQFAAFTFLSTCLHRRYKNFVWLGLIAVCIAAVQTVKADFRNYLRVEYDSEYTERVLVIAGLVYNKYFLDTVVESDDEENENSKKDDPGLLAGFDRAGDNSLERVLAWTPGRVPFWNGETYASIPFIFIPRALWPDKPSRHFWNKFGRVYGYLSTDDEETSVGVGYFAEAYMNFGYLGMWLCAVFMGALIAVVERLSGYFLGDRFHFTYIVFLVPIVNFGADMGSMLSSLVVLSGALLLVRNQLLRMAMRDDYV